MRQTLLFLRRSLSALSLLTGFLLTPILPTHAQSRPAPLANAPLAERMHGEEALQALGNRIRDVAEFHRMSESQLRRLFQRDKSLWVNPEGRLLYICEFEFPQQGPLGEPTNTPPLNPLYPLEQTFKLHSRPGASRTVFLDFDGHDASATVWDYSGGPVGNAPIARPFDLDGSPYTFNTAERQRIQYVWAHVAEDYIQYDIDVTTEDPGVEALRKTSAGDQNFGIRVGIGGDSADWFGNAGGVAYVGSFDDNIDLPCWVFPFGTGTSDHGIAVATSHEVGHTLGLSHDGQLGVTEYYAGHGNWAPIMGVGYNEPVVQWSRGEYTNPSNTEDDLVRMLSFGAVNRADDHGNNIGSATPLKGVTPFVWGIINSQTDLDFFSFETGAGQATITATPAPRGANLHILLSLYNSSGGLITSAQVADSSSTGTQPVTISQNLPAGTYYVSIDGVGVGTGSTGYTDYSSIGQFTLQVTLPGDGSWAATPGGAQVWTNTANWSSSIVPFGLSAIARINNNISGDQNILIDTPVRIGGLLLGDADAANTFTIEASGPGVLQLGATNGSAWVGKTSGFNDSITAPVQLLSDLSLTNTTASDLTLAGGANGAFALNKYGAGRLVLGGDYALAGGLTVNAGTVVLSNTGSFATVTSIKVAAGATLDVSAFAGGWPLWFEQSLEGFGTVTGSVNAIITFITPGDSVAVGTLIFDGNLSLTNGTALNYNLTSVTNTGGADNDLIAVTGDLILDDGIAVYFQHGQTLPETNGTYTILTYGGNLIGGATNFVAINPGNRFSYVFDDSTPGEIRVHISGAPEALVWQGDGSGNLWDVNVTKNWLRGGNPDAFFQGDTVLFETGSASPAISLTGPLAPASVIVSNTVNFVFSGSGKISGAAALTKVGEGALMLATSNDFSGSTVIKDGIVNIGNAAALGLTNVGTFVTNSGQLRLNGFSVGAELITVSGSGPVSLAGAISNDGPAQTNAVRNLTLAGDTTITGSARWDIRGVPASNIVATLTGNGFALTKIGPNQIWLANLGSFNLGDITVSAGTLGFEGANNIVANSSILTVNSGATLAFLNTYDSDFNRAISLNSATIQNDSGHNNLVNTIALSGNNITSVGEAATLDLRAGVSGAGGLTKTGAGILRLASTNSFTGNLVVNAGTVMAGHSSALGDTNGSTTIASGARLDVAAFNLGAEPIIVGGSGINSRGAIINSLTNAQVFALRFVTLTANTTFGGNGRWDIRANPTGALLGAFDLTKVARNEIWLANLGTTQLRNITINEGILGFQGTTTMGNFANTITVDPDCTLAINGTGTNILRKNTVTLSAARLINTTGSNTLSGNLSLSGSNQVDIATASTFFINGNISGSGFFNKTAAGTLIVGGTLDATGLNRVSAGTLQIGNGALTGSLNVNLTNNGTALIFNRRSDLNHTNVIAGTAPVTKQNTNALTLSTANTYSGVTTVSAGTLRVGSASALGTTTTGTTIASGGTLDVNGFSLGAEAITVTGAGVDSAGAVVNNGTAQANAVRSLTLTGNTTLGGNNRWDIRNLSGVGALSSSGQPHVLTKTGPNTIGLADITVDAALGNIAILQGILSIEQTTTGLGNPSAAVTVYNNATLNLHSLINPLSKGLVLDNGGKLSQSGPVSGGVNSTVSGSITLSNGNAFVENSSTLYSLQLNNIGGAGGFTKTGVGLVQLNAVGNYGGNTIITAGTLKLAAPSAANSTPLISVGNGAVLDVSTLGAFVLGPTQVLAGNGTVLGNVTANGTIAPGTSIGQLTVSGNTTLAGNTLMEVAKAGASLTSDVLNVSGTLTCGGTLTVTRTGDALVANDSFKLFMAGSLTGSFANFALPPLDSGLAWDTSTVNSDGWLRVISNPAPVIGSATIINGEIVISGTGGTPGGTYHVVTTTNVTLPMLQWLPVATNTFDGTGNFAFTNAVSLTEEQQFFRVRLP